MKIISQKSRLLILAVLCLYSASVLSAPNTGQKFNTPKRGKRAAGCAPATGQSDLDVNNVRARIMNGGDAWWDLVSTAKYEVPKVTQAGQVRRNVLFAGALWIGGLENNNLKLAAMTYRQSGSDFFPGPLDVSTAQIDGNQCRNWDRIYEMTRAEIDEFKNNPALMTEAIRNWPAHNYNGGSGRTGNAEYFQAPFVDVDKDGEYHPELGLDYPDIFGDQSLWYVSNDKGNVHGETQADAIGLELRSQAFAYSTNDEINDMTFYTNEVINRSSGQLDSTYFGQWVDCDLGNANDDYVGADRLRSMGYCYNGDDNDEGVLGYGANPPTIGIDFFEGPLDQNGKQIGLKYFVYYNNDFSIIGNPSAPLHYYYYLTARWKDGQNVTNGGSGRGGSMSYDIMFDGDPVLGNTGGWTELTAGNRPADRRFLQSSGPFSLKPGARNKVTVGAVYARASAGGATGSISLLRLADDKAQKLYNNQFKLIDGPDAPTLVVREFDEKLILSLENTLPIENYKDKIIGSNGQDVTYKFQGYQIYQLKNSTVTSSELNQVDKARLIGQVDFKDEITDIVNQEFDPTVNQNKFVKYVEGAENNGIRHTFEITSDAFASGNINLVNFKYYYYLVIAYSIADDANEPIQYLAGRRNVRAYTAIPHPNNPEFGGTILNSVYGFGPKITRIEGIGNGGKILEITTETENEILANGKTNTPTYKGGNGPVDIKVYDPTRIAPGKYVLKFLDSVINKVPNPAAFTTLSLATGGSNFSPSYTAVARWELTNTTTGQVILSESAINKNNEQLLFRVETRAGKDVRLPLGISITINQVNGPGYSWLDEKNGFLEATLKYNDSSYAWLGGIEDVDHQTNLQAGVPTPGNWIRSGRYGNLSMITTAVDDAAIDTGAVKTWNDPNESYERLLGGIIAPAALCARSTTGTNNSVTLGPVPGFLSANFPRLTQLPSVDLVFTSDRSKWSECVVLEMGEAEGINEGNAKKFQLRKHEGWLGETDAAGLPVYSSDLLKRGKSLFPGYAINLETGERLNVFFGEDSHLSDQSGNDMIWNPTQTETNPSAGFQDFLGRYLWGGKHWIYVMNSFGGTPVNNPIAGAYDRCNRIWNVVSLSNPTTSTLINTFSSLAWVMEPMSRLKLASIKDGIIPTETRIRLRVERPYQTYANSGKNKGIPLYEFSTDDIAAVQNNKPAGTSALDIVNIVPNPYYATSLYETNQLDNRVRITNIPSKSVIKIYTLDGTLIRTFNKDETVNQALNDGTPYPTTFQDWDLKNQRGVPISSGAYIIHIDGFGLGTKVLKWYGIIKPIDLDTF
ncbi:MAG: hypothetical protein SGJ04_00715 [Bacteroidota bacterium]|nr:hypothetical protein [Bacteroidota bacterium]